MTEIKIIANEHEEVIGVALNGELIIDEADMCYPSYWIDLLKKIPSINIIEETIS